MKYTRDFMLAAHSTMAGIQAHSWEAAEGFTLMGSNDFRCVWEIGEVILRYEGRTAWVGRVPLTVRRTVVSERPL